MPTRIQPHWAACRALACAFNGRPLPPGAGLAPARWRSRLVAACALTATLLLGACGGGGDDAPEPADDGPVTYASDSFYRGHRALNLMMFEGGRLYGLYQSDYSAPKLPTYVQAGFFVAQRVSQAPYRAVYRGRDFDFERQQTFDIELTVTRDAPPWPASPYLAGQIDRQPSTASDSFYATTLEDASGASADRARLPGRYEGQWQTVRQRGLVEATIDEAGGLIVRAPDGCTLVARLTGRPDDDLLDVEATVSDGCSLPRGGHEGHALHGGNENVYVLLGQPDGDGDGLMLQLLPLRQR